MDLRLGAFFSVMLGLNLAVCLRVYSLPEPSMHDGRIAAALDLLQLLDSAQGAQAQEQLVGLQALDVPLAALEVSGFLFPADTSPPTPFAHNARGYGLVMPVHGQPSGVALTVVVDGVPLAFGPGSSFLSPFQRLSIYNTTRREAGIPPTPYPSERGGTVTGTAKFFILTRPSTRLELGKGIDNGFARLYDALYNSAVNIPTLATDGIPLTNGRGARAVVAAPAGATITSGTGVWWLRDEMNAIWAESLIQIDLARSTVRRASSVPDEFITVGRGRAFLEVRSLVHSGGAGVGTVSLYGN